jgi:hypothetical protein
VDRAWSLRRGVSDVVHSRSPYRESVEGMIAQPAVTSYLRQKVRLGRIELGQRG